MSSKYDYVYLAGDFNAQTANLTDYTTEDEFLSKHFDFDDELSSFYNHKSSLENAIYSQESMDRIVTDISHLFSESAALSFERKPSCKFLKHSSKPRNKPWFGTACHHTRKAYNAAKRKYNHKRTPRNLLNLQSASKIYKNTVNKYINKHNTNDEAKLRNLHKKRPKDYWKLLKSLQNKN